MKKANRIVVWQEPVDHPDLATAKMGTTRWLTQGAIIAHMRADKRYAAATDEDCLADFMAVHWAWFAEWGFQK